MLTGMRTSLLLALALGGLLAWARADGPAEGALRVLTYNVHGLPAAITGDDTLARQRAIAARLEPFDVVGLQEDFMDEGHALLVGPATHGRKLRFAATLEGRVYGSGLTCLVRPRVLRRAAEHYRTYAGLVDGANDGFASKGFQVVRLELAPGVEVDVYNTHCDAGGGAEDQKARADQVAHLIESMQGRSAGRAIIFLGDTNLARRGTDPEVVAGWLKTTGLRCACLAAREACCERIDRILVRGGAGVELTVTGWGVAPGFTDAQGRPLSDHEPLEAVVRWRRTDL